MNWFLIITGTVLEIVALIVAVRLWRQKRRGRVSKLFWTVVLLIPFFGLLIYGFLAVNPESQADHNENTAGVQETLPPSF
jgi:uncharacterized protein with PQ loop repeat